MIHGNHFYPTSFCTIFSCSIFEFPSITEQCPIPAHTYKHPLRIKHLGMTVDAVLDVILDLPQVNVLYEVFDEHPQRACA